MSTDDFIKHDTINGITIYTDERTEPETVYTDEDGDVLMTVGSHQIYMILFFDDATAEFLDLAMAGEASTDLDSLVNRGKSFLLNDGEMGS